MFLPKRTLICRNIGGKGLLEGSRPPSCAERFDRRPPWFGGPKAGSSPPSAPMPAPAEEDSAALNPLPTWCYWVMQTNKPVVDMVSSSSQPRATLGHDISLYGLALLSKDVTLNSLHCKIHHLCLDILKCQQENTRSPVVQAQVWAYVGLFFFFFPFAYHKLLQLCGPHWATVFYIVISHSSLILLWKALLSVFRLKEHL